MSPRLGIALHAVSVRRGDTWALRDVSLTLRPGERWALVGGNGAGKTQLLKLIGTDVWPTPTGHGSRTFRLGRRTVDVIEAKQRVAYIGAELQDKYARYGWNPAVDELLATGLHGTDLLMRPITAAERRRVDRMIGSCGLDGLAGRRFLTLSYGEKRVSLLGRALIQNPDWLLLDEFYNGLDGDFRRRIDDLLAQALTRGQSWVAAAHRAMDVPRGCSHRVEMRRGAVVSQGRLRGTDVARLATEADEEPASRGGVPVAAKRVPAPLANETRATAPPAAGPPGAAPRRHDGRGRVLVRIARADLYVEYREVLHDVNWRLRAGEHWAVFGANGAGKSSFLKLLYGDLSPALGGIIERDGQTRGSPIAAWKRRVGLVSPELQTDYAVDVTVRDLVASGRHASIGLCDPATAADAGHAQHWLRFFSLLSMADRRPRELSYGQLRRALFARALAADPRVLLLDEPLTGLDPRQRAAMKRLLARLMSRGLTLVIAVHHAEDLPPGMTHGLSLQHGRVLAVEPYAGRPGI